MPGCPLNVEKFLVFHGIPGSQIDGDPRNRSGLAFLLDL